jgi:Uma2 family endonuclease
MSTEPVLQESSAASGSTQPLPLLENGDELTRDEFERRYQAMPRVSRAELIEGVVYMPSPVHWDDHSAPHADLITWLGTYRAVTPGVRAGDNGSVRLDMDNEPQPDGMLIITPGCGGQVEISDDDFIIGAPELVAEVSASSVSIDLNRKFRVYRRNQVQEYLVWRVLDNAIDWFELRDGDFRKIDPDDDGILKSGTFPGLWLDAEALCRGNLATVLTVLRGGIESADHAAFVERLQQAGP